MICDRYLKLKDTKKERKYIALSINIFSVARGRSLLVVFMVFKPNRVNLPSVLAVRVDGFLPDPKRESDRFQLLLR